MAYILWEYQYVPAGHDKNGNYKKAHYSNKKSYYAGDIVLGGATFHRIEHHKSKAMRIATKREATKMAKQMGMEIEEV